MRCFHIVPAFRGLCVSSWNIAGSGQSVMKTRGKMWLSVAAWRDTCNMIIQDRDYISFCTNKAKVTRKRLQSYAAERERKKSRKKLYNSACEALELGDIEADVLIEMDPSCYFVSNKKAKHKVPANFSSGNPNQEKKKDAQKHKSSSQMTTKTRRKNLIVIVVKKILNVMKIKSMFQNMLRKRRLMKTLLI